MCVCVCVCVCVTAQPVMRTYRFPLLLPPPTFPLHLLSPTPTRRLPPQPPTHPPPPSISVRRRLQRDPHTHHGYTARTCTTCANTHAALPLLPSAGSSAAVCVCVCVCVCVRACVRACACGYLCTHFYSDMIDIEGRRARESRGWAG